MSAATLLATQGVSSYSETQVCNTSFQHVDIYATAEGVQTDCASDCLISYCLCVPQCSVP